MVFLEKDAPKIDKTIANFGQGPVSRSLIRPLSALCVSVVPVVSSTS